VISLLYSAFVDTRSFSFAFSSSVGALQTVAVEAKINPAATPGSTPQASRQRFALSSGQRVAERRSKVPLQADCIVARMLLFAKAQDSRPYLILHPILQRSLLAP